MCPRNSRHTFRSAGGTTTGTEISTICTGCKPTGMKDVRRRISRHALHSEDESSHLVLPYSSLDTQNNKPDMIETRGKAHPGLYAGVEPQHRSSLTLSHDEQLHPTSAGCRLFGGGFCKGRASTCVRDRYDERPCRSEARRGVAQVRVPLRKTGRGYPSSCSFS